MAPYLPALLAALCRPAFCDPAAAPTAAAAARAGSAELRAKCASARRLLASAIELRLLLPAAAALYDQAEAQAQAAEAGGGGNGGGGGHGSVGLCLPPLLETVALAVAASERAAVVGQHERAWRFAAHALGRREALTAAAAAAPAAGGDGGGGGASAAAGWRDLAAVEGAAVGLCVQLTLRLNDALFSPLFNRLIAWAEPAPADAGTAGSGGGRARGGEGALAPAAAARAWPLLRLVQALLERLRGLATPYAARALPIATAVLAARAAAAEDAPAAKRRRAGAAGGGAAGGGGELGALGRLAADAVRLTLLHDVATGAVDAGALDELVSPLVGCCGAEAADGDDEGRALLAATVGALAGALGGAGCARLHYELCALSRDEGAPARLQAVRALEALYSTLGADGAVHVAEVVPAIAELLEDSDEQIEAAARAFLKDVAAHTGEDVEALIRG